MPDELIAFLALGVIVALFFFTPRRGRLDRTSTPVGSGTKAVGACLLMVLAFGAVAGMVCRELTAPSR